jgi:hypothetical protein
VKAIQQAWAQLDIGTLEPEILLAISQHISAVASIARSTFGSQGG